MSATYLMHGLHVQTALPLHHTRLSTAEPDVVITDAGHRGVPADQPVGRLMAHLSDVDGTPLYTFVQQDAGYLLRFHRTCEFEISSDGKAVSYVLDPAADPGLVGVLATGMLVSFLLTIAGHPVLHASAVDVGGRAIAFTGWSGMGKSTAAALVCSDGALFVTDDVLRVDLSTPPICRLGAVEARLRPKAAEVAATFSKSRVTADGRQAIAPNIASNDRLPLAALIVPSPSRELGELSVRRLQGAEAVLTLSRFPRIVGWCDVETSARQFQFLAELARAVPVYIAQIPWGPPFAPGLGAEIARSVGAPVVAER